MKKSQKCITAEMTGLRDAFTDEQRKTKILKTENALLCAIIKKKSERIAALNHDAYRLKKAYKRTQAKSCVKQYIRRAKYAEFHLVVSKHKVTQLTQKNDKLKTELSRANETMQLMQFYPDVNGFVPMVEDSTASVKEMMEKQCKINMERIRILMNMNTSYGEAIKAMIEKEQQSLPVKPNN